MKINATERRSPEVESRPAIRGDLRSTRERGRETDAQRENVMPREARYASRSGMIIVFVAGLFVEPSVCLDIQFDS